MIELPEVMTLARQTDEELAGKRIASAVRGNTPHKWVWYNVEAAEFEKRLTGKTVTGATGDRKSVHVHLKPGHVLRFGDMGGKVLFHPDDSTLPKKHHLLVAFDDGTYLTIAIQGWGFIQALKESEVDTNRHADTGISAISDELAYDSFKQIVDEYEPKTNSVKAFVVQRPRIAGIGNGYFQDIAFRAGLHPRRRMSEISAGERRRLYNAIRKTMTEAIRRGGRDTEVDLYGNPGGYTPILDKRAKDNPCPECCGTTIEKIAFLGGACYFCPACQT